MAWYDDLNNEAAAGGFSQSPNAFSVASSQGKKPVKKKKDFFTDQISTGGGIGGALGGAAAGAALGSVVPGLGTIIGGLAGGVLGGALGSGGGELAENIITNEDDKFKNVGQEALLGGIFSAPPLRAARGLTQVAKGAGKAGFEQAFTGATKSGVKGATQRASESALGGAWGIRPGVKSTGKIITPQNVTELQSFVQKNIGVPKTASAEMVFERAVNFQKETGDAISAAVRAIPAEKVNTALLAKSVNNRFSKLLGVDPSSNQVAKDIITQLGSAKTPEELWNLRKSIDNELISWGRNPASAVPGAEQAARAAREEISKFLTNAAPEIKGLNRQYGNVVDVINLTADATRSPKGFKVPGFTQTVGGATAQRLKAGAGSAVGGLTPNAVPALPGSVRSSTGGIVPTTLRQGIGQNVFGGEQAPALDDALLSQSQPMGGGLDQLAPQISQPHQTPYSQENLMFDLQRDPANAQDYIAYYQSLQEVFGQGAQKPLSSAATKDVSNANVGLTALDQIEGILAQDPNVQQRGGISGTFNPFGLVSGALGTGEYENARAQARDVIARIRTGAALTNDEAKAFDKFLPQPGDSQSTVQQKLAILRQQFQAVAGQGGGNSLEDALLAQGGYGTL